MKRRLNVARAWLIGASAVAVAIPVAFAMSAHAAVTPAGAITGPGGMCVDVAGGNSANGTEVRLWGCLNNDAQRWTLAPDGTVRALGKCLDVTGAGIAAGTPVQLWDCNGGANQQWQYTTAGALVNPHSTRCLGATGDDSAQGTGLQIQDCAEQAVQKWTASAQPVTSKRVVVYYQTQYRGTTYVSPLELIDNNTRVSDVVVAAFHLNADKTVNLNDDPPSAGKFSTMWSELATMQSKGVRVSAMIGGAAQGSFTKLDQDFNGYYPVLKNLITTYHLDGVDLDVEENMSLGGIERLISALSADFGQSFVITLAPVATALQGGGNLSGFDYEQLYRDKGGSISWFNGQFYNGWGSLANTAQYDAIVGRGLIPAQKIVAGALTNPGNGGSGYVEVNALSDVVRQLVARYPDFGGVDGWEYFNSLPGNTAAPWQWSAQLASAQGR